jgi:hypothetical protein
MTALTPLSVICETSPMRICLKSSTEVLLAGASQSCVPTSAGPATSITQPLPYSWAEMVVQMLPHAVLAAGRDGCARAGVVVVATRLAPASASAPRPAKIPVLTDRYVLPRARINL